MSKQADVKVAQGYRSSPVFPTCLNCRHRTSMVREVLHYPSWTCSVGGFLVVISATCDEHDWIEKE